VVLEKAFGLGEKAVQKIEYAVKAANKKPWIKGHIYMHTYFMSVDVAWDATFKLFFRIVYGTAANFVQGIRFSIPLDMKVVELTVMQFNSQ
jgi:hypothetical protein